MLGFIKKIDYRLLAAVCALSLFGALMIYSASSYEAELNYSDSFFYVKKQIAAFFIGLILMFAAAKLNLDLLTKYRHVILIISLVLLSLVFIPGLGVEKYGSKRWINLGVTTFQPSEVAKFGMVVYLAAYLSGKDMRRFRNIIPVLIVGLMFCALIMLEPNMSITMCVGLTMIIMLFVGGVKIKHFMLLSLPLAAVIPVLIIAEPYRMQRILAFIDPWASPRGEGYQLIQSFYALGSGGLFGVGLFNSRQKLLFLPFAESDFIFSVIGEELGLIGAAGVMLLCLYIIYRGVVIAVNSGDRYKTILAAGLISVFAVQTVLNIAVVSGTVPPTGLPMPFVSAGGSSLVSFMVATGLLLNISYCRPSTLRAVKP
ncbi:MAG: putative lipid II flippase FtsW [Christensenellales bacterium]|jgi:cell division protein FtsW